MLSARFIIASLLIFISLNSYSFDSQIDLKTSRGALIKLDIYNSGFSSVLIIGPGQGCNLRPDLYGSIAEEAKVNGFTVINLHWAYCVADPKNGQPADDLSDVTEDFLSALEYARKELKFTDDKIFIGGKSLGSLVSAPIFQSQKQISGLVLLTPVCTEIDPNTKIHKNIFSEYYPELDLETRPVLLAQGNEDQKCDNNYFQDYLKEKRNNFIPLVVKGGHSLTIQNADGQVNVDLSKRNIDSISKWIFTWIK
jgi:predicted esterase